MNGRPAAGVAVRNGKRPVVTLYFDKETGLLVKREATVKDPSADDKEVLEEVEDAYQFADQAPDPAPEELFTDVYADGSR